MRRVFDQARARELEQHAELSLDLIASASFDGFFTRVNPAFTRTLGWDREELLSRPLLEFVHPDDRDATLKAVADQTFAGREVFNFQNRYLTKDGSYRWLEWTSRPDPQSKALIAVARDITERKSLEEQVAEQQRTLEQAVAERTADLEQRTRQLEEAENETIVRLALAAEFRDERTAEHNARVARTSELLARQLGVPADEAKLIGQAAILHDVGKVTISDELLLKPGPLTPQEFELVKHHTTAGAAILKDSNSPVLRLAADIARSHHEWWDGNGYPAGLVQDETPMPARIVAIADVFDAITHARPYKPPWPIEQAHQEIQQLRGRQFDPHVVDAFQQLDTRRLADTPRRAYLTAVA
jgi:PAS domain S-box-containing protein/putative nucleotidyltransferase with HDIG domain